MKVSLQDFEFVGYDAIPAQPGVLIVFCPNGDNMRIMEVLESPNLRETVSNNVRRLGAECRGHLVYQLVVVSDPSSRKELAHRARAHYSVP